MHQLLLALCCMACHIGKQQVYFRRVLSIVSEKTCIGLIEAQNDVFLTYDIQDSAHSDCQCGLATKPTNGILYDRVVTAFRKHSCLQLANLCISTRCTKIGVNIAAITYAFSSRHINEKRCHRSY